MLHALMEAGAAAPPTEALTQYVGPPLSESFAALLPNSDPAVIEIAIAAYRRRFEEVGILENRLYPRIKEALKELSTLSSCLCIVTAKPHDYARQILERLEIANLFNGVYGPELQERQYSKQSLIHKACSQQNVIPVETVMIGDRAEDIFGAKENGLRSVAVAWGYAERYELEKAQPDQLITSSDELVSYIRSISRVPVCVEGVPLVMI